MSVVPKSERLQMQRQDFVRLLTNRFYLAPHVLGAQRPCRMPHLRRVLNRHTVRRRVPNKVGSDVVGFTLLLECEIKCLDSRAVFVNNAALMHILFIFEFLPWSRQND
jgi:hypothetical protein